MEIDAKFRRELTKRFEMESHKKEIEIIESWRNDIERIYKKKHEGMSSLSIELKALMERMENRMKTLKSIIKEES
jgi:hypothetical protein